MLLCTTDIHESSWLLTNGVRLSQLRLHAGRGRPTVVFEFDDEDSSRMQQLQSAYRTGTARVDLTEYLESFELLKERMFKLIRSNGSAEEKNKNQNEKGQFRHELTSRISFPRR